MKHRMISLSIALVAALSLATAGFGQTPSAPPPPGPRVFVRTLGPGMGGPGGPIIFEKFLGDFGGQVVKNAPFSAQITTEDVQVLADGNRIDRTTTGSIARDVEGRTRREMNLTAFGPLAAAGRMRNLIFIHDPVAGQDFILNQNTKVAREISLPSNANVTWRRHAVSRLANSPFAEQFKSEFQKVSLGTKTIEGLSVEGTRITRTIPAGQIGNEKPLVITTERWYSPDLQTTVSLTRSDPRFGTTTYRLTNISRADPPQALFIVPPDYTVKQGNLFYKRLPKGAAPNPSGQ